MPILDQAPQATIMNDNAESHLSSDEAQRKLQSEGNIMKLNPCTNCPMDISQISGPDRTSRLTPLSQIGFRDSASVGAGQQLTSLSIEVLITTHVWFDHIGIFLVSISVQISFHLYDLGHTSWLETFPIW